MSCWARGSQSGRVARALACTTGRPGSSQLERSGGNGNGKGKGRVQTKDKGGGKGDKLSAMEKKLDSLMASISKSTTSTTEPPPTLPWQ
eukprot:4301174-Pyramimonas_sp.AAC.1